MLNDDDFQFTGCNICGEDVPDFMEVCTLCDQRVCLRCAGRDSLELYVCAECDPDIEVEMTDEDT